MGWLSVQATIDMYKLIYLWTLLRIPNLFQKKSVQPSNRNIPYASLKA